MKICQFSDNLPQLCTSPVPVLKKNTVALHTAYLPSSDLDIQELSTFNYMHPLGAHRPSWSLEKFPRGSWISLSWPHSSSLGQSLHCSPGFQAVWGKDTIPLHCPVQLQPFQPGCSLCHWQSCSSEISLTAAVVSLTASSHSVSYPCSFLAPWFQRGWKLIASFELNFMVAVLEHPANIKQPYWTLLVTFAGEQKLMWFHGKLKQAGSVLVLHCLSGR